MISVQNMKDKFKDIKDRPWQGLDLSLVNNHKVRLGFCKGEYGWHKHDNADEFFFVLDGKITIKLKDQPDLVLRKGDFTTLPKGTVHNLVSLESSYVLVFEPIHLQSTRAGK